MKKKLFIILTIVALGLPVNAISAEETEAINEVAVEETTTVETSESVVTQDATFTEEEVVEAPVEEVVEAPAVETSQEVAEETTTEVAEETTNSSETIYAEEIFTSSKSQRTDCSRFCTVLFRDKVEWHLTRAEAEAFTYDQMITEANVRSYFVRECPGKPSPCVGIGDYPYEVKNMEMFDTINQGNVGVYEVYIGFVPGTVENFVDPSSPYVVTGEKTGTMTIYVHEAATVPILPDFNFVNAEERTAVNEGTEITDELLEDIFAVDYYSRNSELQITHAVDNTLAGEYAVEFSLASTTRATSRQSVNSTLDIIDIMPTIETLDTVEITVGQSINDYISTFNVNAYDSAVEVLTSSVVVDSSAVNVGIPGEYPVSFTTTDNEGNTVVKDAKVVVTAATSELVSSDAEIYESALNDADLIKLFNLSVTGSGYDLNDAVFTVAGKPVKDLKPGTYTVTITLGDLTTTSTLVVKADPEATLPQTGFSNNYILFLVGLLSLVGIKKIKNK